MRSNPTSLKRVHASALATNKVLRNTYLLLSLTLLCSAATATWAMLSNAAPVNIFVLLVGMFGLSMLTTALRNSAWGLAAIFAFTGFMGYVLGPILNFYIHAFNNGPQLIATALGGTGIIFFALSMYVTATQKSFSYMGGFLFVAIWIAFMAGLASIFFSLPLLHILLSSAFILISSGLILFQTGEIINGGERNYIMATISLYTALFNLFISLLHVLSFFAGDRR